MSKRNTQEEAMSRLFRTVQKKPTAVPPAKAAPAKPKSAPRPKKRAKTLVSPKPAPVPAKPVVGAEATDATTAAEHERIAPYIRPDQAMALRLAEATKNDPRGRTVSAIVRRLLDEAGYNANYQPTR